MAGDWMKVEKVTPDKPEIEGMAAMLSLDPDAVFGKCFRVWRWFDDHTVDGNAASVTKALLDRRVGVTGFADAMEKVGWLISTPDGVALPKFGTHNGETAKQRSLTAKRVASHKSKSNVSSNEIGNAQVTQDPLPREEKRREELDIYNARLNQAEGDRLMLPRGKSPEFLKFMQIHPKPGSPALAWDVWRAKRDVHEIDGGTGEEFDRIVLDAVLEYSQSPAGKEPTGNVDARLMAPKWLLNECWLEDRKLWQMPNGGKKNNAKPVPKVREIDTTGDELYKKMNGFMQ